MLRAQASNLLGQCEALIGLTSEDDFLHKAIKDLQSFEANENFTVGEDDFKKAHLRIMEISPKLKAWISALTPDKKDKFDKKAERKVNRA